MERKNGIYAHNLRVFYIYDAVRAFWFVSSIWVLFEKQFLAVSQITLIEAVILGVTLVSQLPAGAFADLVGKKKALIAGSLFYGAGMYVFSLATSFNIFLLYALLVGMGEALFTGSREALLYDTMREDGIEGRFDVTSSKLSMIFQSGHALATFVGGWIGSFSYILAIRLTSLNFLITASINLFFREPEVDSEKFSFRGFINKTIQGIREIFKNEYITKVSVFYILIGSVTWICAMSMNMILLTETGYTAMEIGIYMSLMRITNSAAVYFTASRSRFFPKKELLYLHRF